MELHSFLLLLSRIRFSIFTILISAQFHISHSFADISSRYSLINSLVQIPCSAASTPLIEGTSLLQESTSQQITFAEWFLPKAFNDIDYTLFSIHERGSYNLIYSLSYNSPQRYLKHNIKGTNLPSVSIPLNEVWTYIRVRFQLATTTGSMDIVDTEFGEVPPTTPTTIQQASPPGSVTVLDRANILLNIGFSSSLITLTPACALVRLVTLYFNVQFTLDSSASAAHHSKAATNANILSHFDSFYSMTMPKTFLNFYSYQSRFSSPYFTTNTPMELDPPTYLKMNEYSMNDSIGLIIYFEFLCQIPTSTVQSYLSLYNPAGLILKLQLDTFGFLQFSSTTNTESLGFLNSGEWYQLAIIIDNIFGVNISFVLLDSSGPVEKKMKFPSLKIEQLLVYWAIGNSEKIIFNNIRIYKGSLVGETSDCFLETQGDTENHCLMCKPGKVLSYKQKMKCIPIPAAGTTVVKNVEDWPRLQCPTGMLHMERNSNCQCEFSMYRSGSTCLKCPSFCKGCSSLTSCIQKDINRDQFTGKCVGDWFDDGYLCLPRQFIVPNPGLFERPYDGSSNVKYFANSQLGLSGKDTFFVEFWINSPNTSSSTSYSECVGYLRDYGQGIFSIYVKFVATTTYQLCFELVGSPKKCYDMYFKTSTSVGIWFSFSKVIFAMRTAGLHFHDIYSFPTTISSYSAPMICVGSCSPLILGTNTPFSAVSSLDYVKFIKGVTDPSNFMEEFYKLFQLESEVYGHYLFYSIPSSYYQSQTGFLASVASVQLNSGFELYDPFKGIASGTSSADTKLTTTPDLRNPSISMNIFISTMDKDRSFMQMDIDSTIIKFSFVNENIQGFTYIRICIGTSCHYSNYCTIPYQQSTFLSFIVRIENYREGLISGIEIEIVTDYKRETLKWLENMSFPIGKFNSLLIQKNNGNSDVIYYNNIRYLTGSHVYFDYWDSEKCFMFVGTVKRQCIKAKKGFAIFRSKAIAVADCNQTLDLTLTKMVFYNQFTGECELSNVFLPRCKVLVLADLSCGECFDSNADPKANCTCFDGFYYDGITKKCELCHEKCITCSEKDQCTICKFKNTIAPTCSCSILGQYQAANYECKDCQSQCETCIDAADNCVTCSSQDRIEAPVCQCNPQYFHPSMIVCLPYECTYQCDLCEYSERNCVTCGVHRTDPPECKCEENYFEQGEKCIKCNSHEYFDLQTKQCQVCSTECVSCVTSKNQCTECLPELYLYNSSCVCSDLTSFKMLGTGDVVCNQEMDVSVEGKSKNNKFSIVLTFDTKELEEIDFSQNEINQLIFIYFSQIPTNSFNAINARIENGNQIVFDLVFTVNFKFTKGYLKFTEREQFQSHSENKMLDVKYLSKVFEFNLSTLVINHDEWKSNEILESITDYVDNSNFWFDLIQQMQLCFYVLNTLQQTVIFLLVDIMIPPNLYQPLQFIGKFAFNIQNYGETKVKQNYQLMNKPLELMSDYTLNSNPIFNRIEFSGALIVNLPIALPLYFLWPTIIFFLLNLVQVYSDIRGKQVYKIVDKLAPFAYSRVQSGLEDSLLLFTLSACNQYQNTEEEVWLNRISCYCAAFVIIIILYFNYQNLQSMLRQREQKGSTYQDKSALSLLEKLDFERGKTKTIMYYFGQVLKKYSIAIAIVFFYDNPSVICLVGACLQAASFLISFLIKPYKKPINNIIKTIGEACILVIWVIYYTTFIRFTDEADDVSTIPEESMSQFLTFGTISLVLIVIYNLLYLIELIYSQIIVRIIDFRKKSSIERQQAEKGASIKPGVIYSFHMSITSPSPNPSPFFSTVKRRISKNNF